MSIDNNEKPADEMDQAAAITEFMRESRIAERRAMAAPEHHPLFDGLHCVEEDCEAEIPEGRLELQKVRCIDCQARLDRERSLYRK